MAGSEPTVIVMAGKKTSQQSAGDDERPQTPWQHTPPPGYQRPPSRRVNWRAITLVVLVLLIIGLWAGIKAASTPQPPTGRPLPCPSGPKWARVEQGLC